MWGRLVLTGAMALGFHAGVGFGAHATARSLEPPPRLRTQLLDADLLRQILARIDELDDDDDQRAEIPVEVQRIEEAIEELERASADVREATEATLGAAGPEGAMGRPDAAATNQRFGIMGPKDNPDPHLARQAALREAADFGNIGLLNSGAGGDPDAPTAPWGRDESLGTDSVNARGNMWGDSIGDSFGAGGLGLNGIGECGAGRGEGIGLGSVGTLGHSADGGPGGRGQGFGSGHGRLGRGHAGARADVGSVVVEGKLKRKAVERILSHHRSRFATCYRSALAADPKLRGNLRLQFTIEESGAVSLGDRSDAVLRGLGDGSVANCALNILSGMQFPAPKRGTAHVTFTIAFGG